MFQQTKKIRRNNLNFFHISDLHFTPQDTHGIENINKIIESIATYKKEEDILLISGDILNKDFSNYQPIFEKISALKMPFLCCTGNHDKSQNLIAALHSLYAEHPKPISTSKLDYSCEKYPLKIIVLDSFKENTAGGEITNEQFSFLEQEITNSTKPIIIMVHQFPLTAELNFFDKKTGAPWREVFNQIVLKYQSKIKLVVCGHLHNSLISQIGSVPVISGFSANWQADLDFYPIENLKNTARPVGYYIHRYNGEKFISYAITL